VAPHSPANEPRLAALDGWRGISILLVMASHLLPLGPKALDLNSMVGPMGMVLFFTLSGFLITRFLLHHSSIADFLIRRFFRIVPLAWLAMLVALPMDSAPINFYLPNFLFYANLPPQHLTDVASHLWSLCVEMQFYVGIALLVRMLGRRGLYLVPFLCLAITAHRISSGAYVDIVTWRRADEILAGSVLAMVFEGRFGLRPVRLFGHLNAYLLILLLAVCSHPASGFMNYLRPYVAALLVGVTLFNPPQALARLLRTRTLGYIAAVSFALYVVHHILIYSWLGSGTGVVKYAKRPLLLAATLLLAHVSTFHFEHRCIELGKRLSRALPKRPVAKAVI
jgi:peptidoglycan/LPS O-acetylase OafA/YrhL